MSIGCEHCGGTLKVKGYEQEMSDPASRIWHLVCPTCGLVHEYSAAWLKIRTLPRPAPAAPARAFTEPAATIAAGGSPALAW